MRASTGSAARFATPCSTAARKKGLPLQVPQVGSMFAVFFTATPVRDYATALSSDAKRFAQFFRACLEGGSTFRQAPTNGLPEHRARGCGHRPRLSDHDRCDRRSLVELAGLRPPRSWASRLHGSRGRNAGKDCAAPSAFDCVSAAVYSMRANLFCVCP